MNPPSSSAPPAGRLRDLFSNQKDFRHRWIGSPLANRLGLHKARVTLAAACAATRRGLARSGDDVVARALDRDGLVVIENALPPSLHAAARSEYLQALQQHAVRVPRPKRNTKGFGAPIANDHGFDRYDGGSLNRFVRIGADQPALREAFAAAGPLGRRLRALCGVPVADEQFFIYQLIHGPEPKHPDLQRRVHCDTFHETFKAWYFFDAVTLAHGPLMYARGTHRNSRARLAWETRCAVEGRSTSAAFRITPGELAALGWDVPQAVLAPANSLVLANTRGFHCRATADAGVERSGIYANLRHRAFSLRT